MTLSYEQARDSEQMAAHTPAINAFINSYRNPPSTTSACGRQTVFFFPGGMASQLKRADQAFVDGAATLPAFTYSPVWVTPNTFVGGARDLEMHRDSAGTFRDKGDRIIVADGTLALGACTPHDGLVQWCANNNADLFVFCWDWRRRLEETVKFFVGTFLPTFRNSFLAASLPDPLQKFSLVGHSFGGMLVNLILRGNDPIVANLSKAITVATPFYGYAGQTHRWFEGEPWLNGLGLFTKDIVKVIGSLPSLYTVQFLDEAIFGDSETASVLASDAAASLAAYPSVDGASAAIRADPYNPLTNGAQVRYPQNTGFDRSELDYARLQIELLASPMAPALLSKFYNIRGVHTPNNTAGSIGWGWIQPNFDPRFDASPVSDGPLVAGDDTQPAWSTRLARNGAQCVTIAATDIQHMFMMNHPQVVSAIGTILCTPGVPVNPPASTGTPTRPAKDELVLKFLRWLLKHRKRIKHWRRFDDKGFLEILPPGLRENLGAIGTRFIRDVFKRQTLPNPPPRGGNRRRGNKPRPGGGEPPRKKRPRRSTVRK